MKHFGEKGEWAYRGTSQFFWIYPIISGTRKATDFKFGQIAIVLNREALDRLCVRLNMYLVRIITFFKLFSKHTGKTSFQFRIRLNAATAFAFSPSSLGLLCCKDAFKMPSCAL